MDANKHRTSEGHGSGMIAGMTRPDRLKARARLCALLVAGLGLTVSPGCQSGMFAKKNPGTSRLSPRSVPYLTSVAVPSGFQMSERVTNAYESGGIRFAEQKYTGFADPYAVREFYREQMPVMGWREISSHDIKGRQTMRFENSNEECTVNIEPGWFNRSIIEVIVKPFNRSVSEPPPRRPMP